MGACGCGDGSGLGVRFKGPGKTWYIIEMYLGCRDCQEYPGVRLWSCEEDEDDPFWHDIKHMPVINITVEPYGIPTFNMVDLRAGIRELYGDQHVHERETLEDFVEEDLFGLLTAASHKLGRGWMDLLEKKRGNKNGTK